jgi:LDH2 family malate/lactate/ureidoglycolate dehydrogenase
MKRIREGVLAPSPDIVVKEITPVVCQVDGQNGASMGSQFYARELD